MGSRILTMAATVVLLGSPWAGQAADADGWEPLFDGKALAGWKSEENAGSCRVEDGRIVLNGPRSHLFYVGPVQGGTFTDFEFQAEVFVLPKSNSGIYFHSKFQGSGWPQQGYEAQINNTHSDRRKTGGLYGVADVMDTSPVKDREWFTYNIRVEGKHITVRINDQVTTDYTEPEDPGHATRKLSSGTFALQAHDPGSRVEIRNIRVKPLGRTAATAAEK